MDYRDPYTGMQQYTCVNIVKSLTKPTSGLFEVTDDRRRLWLCMRMGQPTTEPVATVIAADILANLFANAMGEPIDGHIPNHTPEELKRWSSLHSRIIEVGSPSIEELPQQLAIISVNINGRRIYPNLPQCVIGNRQPKPEKIGSSSLDPKPAKFNTTQDDYYTSPSFSNTLRNFFKRG